MAPLAPEHLDYLAARGIPADVASRLYSADGSTLLIPYSDPQGQPYVIRSDDKAADGRPFVVRRLFPQQEPKFRTPASGGNRPYFSPLMPAAALSDTARPLVVVEGPIKCDALWLAIPDGYCFVALSGVWNFRDRRDSAGIWHEGAEERTFLQELKEVPMARRKVVVLFDSDIADNPTVNEAAKAFGHWAKTRGAMPYLSVLPCEPDGRKNGADDFVVRHGAEALVEQLEAAGHLGWPLPAPLLKSDGSIRGNLTLSELEQAAAAVAGLSLRDQSILIPGICSWNRLPLDRFEAMVRTAMAPEVDQLEAPLADLDEEQQAVDWLIPGLLSRGEAAALAAAGGVGKSLLMYDLAAAVATGAREFLGMRLQRRRVLLIQTEEPPAVYGARLAAVGMRSRELMARRGQDWDILDKFDFADPRQRRRLEEKLEAFRPDLVLCDSLREISCNVACDENKDIGKRVVRPLRQMLRDNDIALLLIHHSSGSSKLAGDKDIAAAVDRVIHLGLPEGADPEDPPSSRVLTTLKNRSGSHYSWSLDLRRRPGAHQSEDCDDPTGWEWVVVGRGRGIDGSLPLAKRVDALLDQSLMPLSLRDIAAHLDLPPDGTRVNKSLRNLGGDPSYGISRWKQAHVKGEPATYWKPLEDRSPEARAALAVEAEAGAQDPRNPKDEGGSLDPLYTCTVISGPSSNSNASEGPDSDPVEVISGSLNGPENAIPTENSGPENSVYVRGGVGIPPDPEQPAEAESTPATAGASAGAPPSPQPPAARPDRFASLKAAAQVHRPKPKEQPQEQTSPKPHRAGPKPAPQPQGNLPIDRAAAALAVALEGDVLPVQAELDETARLTPADLEQLGAHRWHCRYGSGLYLADPEAEAEPDTADDIEAA